MMTVNPFTAEQFQMLSLSMFYSNIDDCQILFETGKLHYENFVQSRFLLQNWCNEASVSAQKKVPKIITPLRLFVAQGLKLLDRSFWRVLLTKKGNP